MAYAKLIRQFTAPCPNVDPRHIEAWMRSEHGTLDHLSREQFAVAVHEGIIFVAASGTAQSEELARSYGL
jgi:hypothetical protein